MADPLSVAGLALGVVSLGLQVVGGVTTYVDALDCRRQDIASVTQQNDSLQKTLQVVDTLRRQLQLEFPDGAAAVHDCLESCKSKLKALGSFVGSLTACDQSTTGSTSKLKNKGKKLLYPFHRQKLQQLEESLRTANEDLQLALQILGLSVSRLGTEKLSRNISAAVLVFQSEVSAMNMPLQGIHSTVSGLDARVQNVENLVMQLLAQPRARNESPEEITPAVTVGRLLAKPGLLRDTCDAVGIQGAPASNRMLLGMNHGAAHSGNTISSYMGRSFLCLCRHRRRLQRKNFVWGDFGISVETETEKHLPPCPRAENMAGGDQSRRIGLTYTGLRRLLNSAVQLSFAMTSGAGSWSISPTFAYYPTVDSNTDPAFRILSLLTPFYITCHGEVAVEEEFCQMVVSAIIKLLQTKKASPRAVDACNRSLVHYLVKSMMYGSNKDKANPLLELLNYLLVNKAPAHDYDISGYTPIGNALRIGFVHTPLRVAAAELMLQSSVEPKLAFMPDSDSRQVSSSFPYLPLRDTIQVFAKSSMIAEAFGCGPLSLAILANNLEEVRHLVKNHPATLDERNQLGQSPLHLAVYNPPCLRVLVQAADTRLLDYTAGLGGWSALETALIAGGPLCREDRPGRRCRRCKCAESAIVLLKADCALPNFSRLKYILGRTSQRCKIRFIRHIKDRRDRLKQLALDNLPAMEVERLNLVPGRVLDSLGPRVVQLLEDYGVQVPPALLVAKTQSRSSSIYGELGSPADAELFFQVGFHDTDSWCDAEATSLKNLSFKYRGLHYLHWLAKHGATSCQLRSCESEESKRIGYYIYFEIGMYIMGRAKRRRREGLPYPTLGLMPWVQELNATALQADIADTCRCNCSPGGCTPLTFLLKGMCWCNDQPSEAITGFTLYLEHFLADFEIRHHIAALRYLTYTRLGIPHACHLRSRYSCGYNTDLEEYEEENAYGLALLEGLLDEFEPELIAILQDPDQGIDDLLDFWQGTWLSRMENVLESLKGNDLTEDEKRGAEDIGVKWHNMGPEPQRPEVIQNPYDRRTLEHWMYELEKIEAECQ